MEGIYMDTFMKRAIELALENVHEGGQPFGAVLVKGDEIIAEGVNELHKIYDISGHAELLVIRRAQEKAQTLDLSGYTMYASGEPCPMCLAAMYFAGVNEVYYCASIDEAEQVGLGKSKEIYTDLKKDNKERAIVKVQMPLERGMENPMHLWHKKMSE